MDAVENLIASKRVAKWPEEWQGFVCDLPSDEGEILRELAAFFDAEPVDELASDRRSDHDEREAR